MPKNSTPTPTPTPTPKVNTLARKPAKRQAKKKVILLKGWRIHTKARRSGKSKGNEDKYYTSPTGKTFRSQRTMNSYIDDHTPVSALCSNGPQPQYQQWRRDKQGHWVKE